jgi:hypothetical protein
LNSEGEKQSARNISITDYTMPSSLTVARWCIRTHMHNSLAQQTKEISLRKTQQRYRGNGKNLFWNNSIFEIFCVLVSAALITTILLFVIKLPSYIERYSR